MKRSGPYLLLLGATIVWCLLLLLPPVVAFLETSSPEYSGLLYAIYSPVCHQYDSRSLHIAGHKLAVCGRCSAVYFAFLGGLVLSYFMKRRSPPARLLWLAVAATPMAVDALLDLAGLHPASMASRIGTGALFGLIAAVVLAPSMEEGIEQGIGTLLAPKKGIVYESKA